MFDWTHLRKYSRSFPVLVVPHLSDGAQKLPVAVHDDQERHDEAEDKQADDVRYAIRRLGRPVDRAGGPRTLWAIVAPAKERRHSPDEGVDPGQGDAQVDLLVVGGVRLSGRHHGAVALIGEDGQGDQGDDAYRVDRAHAYTGPYFYSPKRELAKPYHTHPPSPMSHLPCVLAAKLNGVPSTHTSKSLMEMLIRSRFMGDRSILKRQKSTSTSKLFISPKVPMMPRHTATTRFPVGVRVLRSEPPLRCPSPAAAAHRALLTPAQPLRLTLDTIIAVPVAQCRG
ncbi:hypothetical protein EYF80_008221 [Liparis tanakae]|uniref:Uncharacterized protein n=1 Tax=Liparis tanakae TaxID=230148 RepID=A0A4Z2ITV7_9TELE|nr:hypothetical protein EYF80_008221 [Liparis tanakae]